MIELVGVGMFLFGLVVGAVLVFRWSNEKYTQLAEENTGLYMENALMKAQMSQVVTDEDDRAERAR